VTVEGAAARRMALDVLARIEEQGAFANLVLDATLSRSGLSREDRGFVTDLVYGSVRLRRACDHLVDRFLSSDPPGPARRALRLGAYQLAFREDIPDHAAVGATVEACPRRFRGLVNAVLRRVATATVEFPDEATRLSYPDWIIERMVGDLGHDDAVTALEEMNRPGRPTVREDGYTQDRASLWVAELVPAGAGDLVLDLCAAPGGKATAIARSGATVVAADLRPHRVGLVVENARATDARSVHALVADARCPPFGPGCADAVLIDAPCSGLGVLRRRADARWRIDAAAPERLAELQRSLVDAAVPLVRPGGVLVYSVCTLTDVESLGVDRHLARVHPGLEPLPAPDRPWNPLGRGARLLPQSASTDGMAIFRYRVPG
jgi:16S rRNA (cytosine967-C5)-methyltransferase